MSPLETTRAVFEAFGRADVDAIMEFMAEDVRVEFYGPRIIPYANTYNGRAETRRFFEIVLSSVDIHQFDAEEFICEGDKVVVTGHLNLTARSTGKTIDSDFVHVITAADGKWRYFRDFMNTFVAALAFGA
ncbi:MAG TPA: nuclear transport factor 2 family protein [Verrucomicrobiae bacterium]|nr:nuclear transport factor 2 family protein [Verrucomicrobiae bacterium]